MPLQSRYRLGRFCIRWNWLIAAGVMLAALGLGRLGVWQLERAAEKVAAQQALLQQQEADAEPIESIPPALLQAVAPELANRHVALQGEYLNDRTILLLAEFFDNQIGYGVVTPFRLDSNGQLVLVHRGWTTGILPPDTPPATRPYFGATSIKAQIHLPRHRVPVMSGEIDASRWPLWLRHLEVDVVAAILGEAVFPFPVRLTEAQPGGLVRHWPAVRVDVDQHLFYALQWFLFAAVVVVGAVLASSNLWRLLQGTDPATPDRMQ